MLSCAIVGRRNSAGGFAQEVSLRPEVTHLQHQRPVQSGERESLDAVPLT